MKQVLLTALTLFFTFTVFAEYKTIINSSSMTIKVRIINPSNEEGKFHSLVPQGRLIIQNKDLYFLMLESHESEYISSPYKEHKRHSSPLEFSELLSQSSIIIETKVNDDIVRHYGINWNENFIEVQHPHPIEHDHLDIEDIMEKYLKLAEKCLYSKISSRTAKQIRSTNKLLFSWLDEHNN